MQTHAFTGNSDVTQCNETQTECRLQGVNGTMTRRYGYQDKPRQDTHHSQKSVV